MRAWRMRPACLRQAAGVSTDDCVSGSKQLGRPWSAPAALQVSEHVVVSPLDERAVDYTFAAHESQICKGMSAIITSTMLASEC